MFAKRFVQAGKDPWLGLLAVFGGGMAIAVSVPVAPAVLIGAGMWGVGAAVGALFNSDEDEPTYDDKEAKISLREGTIQAQMVEALTAYVHDLRTLRSSALPASVVDPAIAALVAAEGAKQTALRVAAAVDGLDTALARTGPQSALGKAGVPAVREAVTRMVDRRNALLGKLQATVDGVAEVYTKLLETSATVNTLDVGDGALTEVQAVNDSLDSLRTSLAELESEQRALP